jgi:glutathione S-transferase
VGYWLIRGLGAPLRMMCAYAGADYDAKTYEVTGSDGNWDRSAWITDAKPGLKAKNAMMNLPYVIDGDVVITQSNACMDYLGEKFGLMGSGAANSAQVRQCMNQAMDLRNAAVGCFYSGSDAAAHVENAKGHYTKFNDWLSEQGTDYCAGMSPSAADFHLWEMLDQHEQFCVKSSLPPLLHGSKTYPELNRFYQRFRALPALQGYFDGNQYKMPINNKMAAFGGVAYDVSNELAQLGRSPLQTAAPSAKIEVGYWLM